MFHVSFINSWQYVERRIAGKTQYIIKCNICMLKYRQNCKKYRFNYRSNQGENIGKGIGIGKIEAKNIGWNIGIREIGKKYIGTCIGIGDFKFFFIGIGIGIGKFCDQNIGIGKNIGKFFWKNIGIGRGKSGPKKYRYRYSIGNPNLHLWPSQIIFTLSSSSSLGPGTGRNVKNK